MFGFGSRKRLKTDCVATSETGLVRKDNQDALFVDPSKTLFCVADGMGGGAEGATASRIVSEEISKVASVRGLADRIKAVDAAIGAANERIRTYSLVKGFRQMGSTVAVLMVDPENLRRGAVCHIGDSRVYRLRSGSVQLLTRDHTVGAELEAKVGAKAGRPFAERSNPLAHVLTRVIGTEPNVEREWRKIDVAGGDRFVVCSDGVHDVIDTEALAELVAKGSPEVAARTLAAEVVRRGAPDNYSFVIADAGGQS